MWVKGCAYRGAGAGRPAGRRGAGARAGGGAGGWAGRGARQARGPTRRIRPPKPNRARRRVASWRKTCAPCGRVRAGRRLPTRASSHRGVGLAAPRRHSTTKRPSIYAGVAHRAGPAAGGRRRPRWWTRPSRAWPWRARPWRPWAHCSRPRRGCRQTGRPAEARGFSVIAWWVAGWSKDGGGGRKRTPRQRGGRAARPLLSGGRTSLRRRHSICPPSQAAPRPGRRLARPYTAPRVLYHRAPPSSAEAAPGSRRQTRARRSSAQRPRRRRPWQRRRRRLREIAASRKQSDPLEGNATGPQAGSGLWVHGSARKGSASC